MGGGLIKTPLIKVLRNLLKIVLIIFSPHLFLDGVMKYDFMDKYVYKKLDSEKIMFNDDPRISKKYENVLLKKMTALEKLVQFDENPHNH